MTRGGAASDPAGVAPDHVAAAALDANFAALIRWYADRPGGEIVDHGGVTTCSTGLSFRAINCAVGIDLDPALAAARIEAVRVWFEDRAVPSRWLVGPTSGPADIDQRLVGAGFECVSDNPGMALDLARYELEASRAGVDIATVDDVTALDAWAEVQRRALDLDPVRTTAWRDAHDRAMSADVALRDWVARVDGVPVAAAGLFVGAHVAGVYNVVTIPEARGRGIGRAVTRAVLDEAVGRGLAMAVLGSSVMGYPVYHGLGFREVSRLRSYALADPGPR